MEVRDNSVNCLKVNNDVNRIVPNSSNARSSEVDFACVRVLENLHIKISEAKKLIPGYRDSRNCYCSVQLDCEEIYKTRVVEKTVSPYFQEEFDFDIPHKFHLLCFYLHDLQGDVLSKRDTVFAKVVVKKSDLCDHNGVEHWFPLSSVEHRSEVQGQVFIEVKFQKCLTLSQSSSSGNAHKLIVKIPKCNGLFMSGGNCDPYVAVTLQGSHRSDTKKSRARKANVNPSFDEEFTFELNKTNSMRRSWFDLSGSSEFKSSEQEDWSSQVLKVAIYSAGTLGDDFMGEVRIPLSEMDFDIPHCGWYLLKPRADKLPTSKPQDEFGSLRVKITYSKDVIFSSHIYQDFLHNMLDSAKNEDSSWSWPTLIGAICGSKLQLKAAESLVHVFLHQDQLPHLILPLADDEIANTKNLSAIFRGSSFTSFLIEECLRVTGTSYLQKVFCSFMEKIKSESKSCEIDPSRLPQVNSASSSSVKNLDQSASSNEILHNNMLNLWEYVQFILSNIVKSSAHFPARMSEIFAGLKHSAVRHHPDDLNVRYRVVTNFLFLRTFSTALLCPRKNKILSDELSTTAVRTFTLVSKVLQQMCNLSLPQQGNSPTTPVFMKNFTDRFVKQHHLDSIRKFIDKISSAPVRLENGGCVPGHCEKVTLKEGEMKKRVPKRRFCFGRKKFKSRYFVLTTQELVYSETKKSKPLCVIPVQHIKAVEKLQVDSFRMPYMFKIIHANRVLFCKVSNSVEQKEWIDALTKVSCCYNSQHHNSIKLDSERMTPTSPASVHLSIDHDRALERLYAMLASSVDKIRSLQEECGARSVYVGPVSSSMGNLESDGTDRESVDECDSSPPPKCSSLKIRDARLTYQTLCSILECIQHLDYIHQDYEESVILKNAQAGTKDKPFEGT